MLWREFYDVTDTKVQMPMNQYSELFNTCVGSIQRHGRVSCLFICIAMAIRTLPGNRASYLRKFLTIDVEELEMILYQGTEMMTDWVNQYCQGKVAWSTVVAVMMAGGRIFF